MRLGATLLLSLGIALTPTLQVVAQEAKHLSRPAENRDLNLGSYPDTADGLHDLLQSVIVRLQHANWDETSRLYQTLNRSLVVPELNEWLSEVYSLPAGREIAGAYRSSHPDLASELRYCDLEQLSEIRVTRLEFPDRRAALSSGIHFFVGMKKSIPVYTVYLTDPQNKRICVLPYLFVYVQRAFRVIAAGFGKFDEDRRPLCGVHRGLEHLLLHSSRMDGETMQARLIQPAAPVHSPHPSPPENSGTVILSLVIACDGSVLAADYVSGPPEFFRAASDAVKKWHYQKTFLNNEPIEVLTTATVAFGTGE